ncbi:MAG: hypothetical protein BEN19_02415 [Epulopiscium sp. Nuni2H_MBin003]|nr:MAG: hypothetical protein BEN19_02415 [Epulopiscium sp. Nuni2H_MBin003]
MKFKKLAVILTTTSLFTINIFAQTYVDVPSTHWAYNAVLYMQEHGYMAGTSDGQFLPNQTINYFEMCEILAKMTGYLDENIHNDLSDELNQQIQENYALQLPIIEEYQNQTQSWSIIANEEIAYLLGKGYLHKDELANFVVDNTRAIVKKEDLAVILVRIIGQESNAQSIYQAGAFTDEINIEPYKRPHVTYLKNLGVIQGGGNGEFGAGSEVTRAVIAKMTADVMGILEIEKSTEEQSGTTVTLNRIIKKNNDESYLLVEFENGKTTFYTIKHDTIITTPEGIATDISYLAEGYTAKITVDDTDTIEYVTHIQVISEEKKPDDFVLDYGTDETTPDVEITGQVQMIAIKYPPEVTIVSDNVSYTFVINQNSILYDDVVDTDISYTDLKLYSQVSIKATNNELTELVVDRYANSLKYKGTIQSIENEGSNIQVLIEYDVLTNTTMFLKDIKLSTDTAVVQDGKPTFKSILTEGMDIIITYDAYDAIIPREILILE